MAGARVTVLGVFMADLAFRAKRLPQMGETLRGEAFSLGPGGKGSNQAIAAARAGASVSLITRIGRDGFGEMARELWKKEGIASHAIGVDEHHPTGTAFIFVSTLSGDNAIIIAPGAAEKLYAADIDAMADVIKGSDVFITQFEQPIETARRGLHIAREAGVTTILNPAPAHPIDDTLLALCDYVTPNETEAALLTECSVKAIDEARQAARRLVQRGARNALITLGEKGALLYGEAGDHHLPAFPVSMVIDTTGAGDAFNGAFAVGLAEKRPVKEAMRFGAAAAALSIQKTGAAASMPTRADIEALMAS